MAISERTRKTLWTMAAARCSICRIPLATEGTDSDDPSVFGEEAHIVARSPGGPRAGEIAQPDSYDNLILLCSKDHKRIDDQAEWYTVERLRAIKLGHESWVRTLGEVAVEGIPVRGYTPVAPAAQPAFAFALNIQMSEETAWLCAIVIVALGIAALAYQARVA